MLKFLIFLHFLMATSIIILVLLQRSSESSILVSSTQFSPGMANKLLVRITRGLVIAFLVNCLVISYIKYGNHENNAISNASQNAKTEQSVPMN